MRVLDSSDNMDSFIKENKISMIYFSSNACNVCVCWTFT